jgi:hypothetical protein
MKKIMSAALALAMTLTLAPTAFAAGGTAYASTQAVEVDGKKIEFQMYALKDASGNGTNYVKLRDVAHVLNGTGAQFSVGYDNASKSIAVTTGAAYADTGTEMTTPYSGDRAYQTGSGAVLVNGAPASLDAIVLTDDAGGGYTYFKLRDLGTALGFTVDWSADRGVIVETGGAAQTTDPTQPGTSYTYDELANCCIDALLCWNNGGQCMKMILTEAMNAEEARAENKQGEAVQKMRGHVNEMLSYAEELLAIVNQYPDIFAETISDEESVIAGLKTLQSMDFTSRDDIYFVLALSDQWIKVSKDLNALEDLILSYK